MERLIGEAPDRAPDVLAVAAGPKRETELDLGPKRFGGIGCSGFRRESRLSPHTFRDGNRYGCHKPVDQGGKSF
jgi:hypothetical protein